MKVKLAVVFFLALGVIFLNSGCALKYGRYEMDDPVTAKLVGPGDYYSGEANTPAFLYDRFNISLGVGFFDGNSSGKKLNTTMGKISASKLEFKDVYSTLRFYPFNVKKRSPIYIKPYVGFGGGYFRLATNYNRIGDYSGSVGNIDLYEIDNGTKTEFEGFNSHFIFGVEIPVWRHLSIVVESRQEHGREDEGFDLNGNVVTGGIKVNIPDYPKSRW